jgi:hypothetical protein
MSNFDEMDYEEEFVDEINDGLTEEISEDIKPKKLKKPRKKPSEQKHKIAKIENGIIYFYPSQLKTKTIHTKESKQMLREAMKRRGVSPRQGTSKKPQNLFSQLTEDYKQYKFSKNDSKIINRWLKENKEALTKESNEELMAKGIITTYQHDKFFFSEIHVPEIFYENNDINFILEDSVIDKMDLENEIKELEELYEYYSELDDVDRCLEIECDLYRLKRVI